MEKKMELCRKHTEYLLPRQLNCYQKIKVTASYGM